MEKSGKLTASELYFPYVVANVSIVYSKYEDAAAGGVDGMTMMSYLHEPGTFPNLSSIYQLHEIYYKGAPLRELSTHVFAIADVAFRLT